MEYPYVLMATVGSLTFQDA